VVPKVKLPLDLLVVKHGKELEGKSTAVHVKLLCPEQATLTIYDPKLPETIEELSKLDSDEAVVLFPDETSKSIAETDWSGVKRLIVIDGTWRQAKAMIQAPGLRHLVRRVRLNENNRTLFWRYQEIGPHCLSTIEAIHRFYQEFQADRGKVEGSLDNLLFFFSFFYNLIQDDYANNPDRRYTRKHREDYISKRSKVD
jgi:DTW domain-containing protein YfiP